jgi:hypothetical protein
MGHKWSRLAQPTAIVSQAGPHRSGARRSRARGNRGHGRHSASRSKGSSASELQPGGQREHPCVTDDPSGKVEVAWAHRMSGVTARWQNSGSAAAFHDGGKEREGGVSMLHVPVVGGGEGSGRRVHDEEWGHG